MQESEIIPFLQKQVTFEHEVADAAEEGAQNIENFVIHELLSSIAMDSRKHAKILQATIRLISEPSPSLEKLDLQKTRKIIQEHMQKELEAINTYEGLSFKHRDDKKLWLIFQYLRSDERRHHAILSHLIEVLGREESLTEEAIWDLFWQYSRLAELALEQTLETRSQE
ncbi:MAG: hypothetical protein ACFFB3_10045 [Candidatus Hodarchaeota archaeon]